MAGRPRGAAGAGGGGGGTRGAARGARRGPGGGPPAAPRHRGGRGGAGLRALRGRSDILLVEIERLVAVVTHRVGVELVVAAVHRGGDALLEIGRGAEVALRAGVVVERGARRARAGCQPENRDPEHPGD